MSRDRYGDGCFRMVVGAIVLAFVGFIFVAQCSSRQYYKEQARLEADRAVMRAKTEAIKAKGRAEQLKYEQSLKEAASKPRTPTKRTETIIYQTPHKWSGVGTKSRLNPDGTITITIDPRHATQWDKDKIITSILDDVDVEDLYDYYDYELPEGY